MHNPTLFEVTKNLVGRLTLGAPPSGCSIGSVTFSASAHAFLRSRYPPVLLCAPVNASHTSKAGLYLLRPSAARFNSEQGKPETCTSALRCHVFDDCCETSEFVFVQAPKLEICESPHILNPEPQTTHSSPKKIINQRQVQHPPNPKFPKPLGPTLSGRLLSLKV